MAGLGEGVGPRHDWPQPARRPGCGQREEVVPPRQGEHPAQLLAAEEGEQPGAELAADPAEQWAALLPADDHEPAAWGEDAAQEPKRAVAADVDDDIVVPNKPALLDGMVDAIFDEIEVPADPDWRTGLRQRAISQRRVLHTHRWALGVLESRTSPGLATLRHHDAVLGYLRTTGFTMRAAGHAYALLDAFVFGFVLQEQELPFDAASAPDLAGSILDLHPGAELPHLAEYAREVVMAGDYDFADEFDVGLGLLLDAVARLRE